MRGNLEQRVYDHLVRKLSQGEISPGARLSEIALAQEIGVSRTPVREAFTRLRTEGVVDVLPRFGWFVRIPSRQEIVDLYEAREWLERFTAAQAAERATADDLDELQRLLDAMDQSLRDWSERPRSVLESGALQRTGALDRAFHEVIFRAAGNTWITRMGAQLEALGQAFNFKVILANAASSQMLTLPKAGQEQHIKELARVWEVSVRDHHQIALAIRKHQPTQAEELMTRHIRAGLETSLATMDAWHRLHPRAFDAMAMAARHTAPPS
jgi:DNA-binding GntR family transcriptional regulator